LRTAVFWGCVISNAQFAYELSVREVLPRLGVELVDLDGVSCCGVPVMSVNMNASIYLATRNLAIAEKTGLKDLLVLCTGCHLSFSEAIHYRSQDDKLREKIDSLLSEEGLNYTGSLRMWYITDLLYNAVKKETIQQSTKKKLNELRLASHYGCHAIRPSSIDRVDHPETPRKLDELIEWLGAKSEAYPEKLDCCGALLLSSHHDAAFTFAGLKLKAIQERGFDGVVVTCPACHRMFDERQRVVASTVGSKLDLPVLYYTQLLGIAMGIAEEKLGLHLNRSPVDNLLAKIG